MEWNANVKQRKYHDESATASNSEELSFPVLLALNLNQKFLGPDLL